MYEQLLESYDEGVAEFLGLERVKPNTLGNARMLSRACAARSVATSSELGVDRNRDQLLLVGLQVGRRDSSHGSTCTYPLVSKSSSASVRAS